VSTFGLEDAQKVLLAHEEIKLFCERLCVRVLQGVCVCVGKAACVCCVYPSERLSVCVRALERLRVNVLETLRVNVCTLRILTTGFTRACACGAYKSQGIS